jgi:hypothetical protein
MARRSEGGPMRLTFARSILTRPRLNGQGEVLDLSNTCRLAGPNPPTIRRHWSKIGLCCCFYVVMS